MLNADDCRNKGKKIPVIETTKYLLSFIFSLPNSPLTPALSREGRGCRGVTV
jgi:hypothetical protein